VTDSIMSPETTVLFMCESCGHKHAVDLSSPQFLGKDYHSWECWGCGTEVQASLERHRQRKGITKTGGARG